LKFLEPGQTAAWQAGKACQGSCLIFGQLFFENPARPDLPGGGKPLQNRRFCQTNPSCKLDKANSGED
jgi:hypothetical protein